MRQIRRSAPLLASTVLLISSLSSFASNKDAPDALTPPPPMPRNAAAQLFLGSVEVTAASVLLTHLDSPDVRKVKKQLSAVQDRLGTTKLLMTKSEAEAELQKLTEIQKMIPVDEGIVVNQQIERLEAQLKSGAFITAEERAAQVAAAEVQIATLRANILVAGKGFLKKGLKGLNIVGGTLLIVDVTGRVYIWAALGRNPRLSPLVSVVRNRIVYSQWGAEPATESSEPK